MVSVHVIFVGGIYSRLTFENFCLAISSGVRDGTSNDQPLCSVTPQYPHGCHRVPDVCVRVCAWVRERVWLCVCVCVGEGGRVRVCRSACAYMHYVFTCLHVVPIR